MTAIRIRFIATLPFLLWLFAAAMPSAAFAESKVGLDDCNGYYNNTYTEPAYTQKVVGCVNSYVQDAVGKFLIPFSNYMVSTVSVMIVLAIAFFGMRVLGGEAEMKKKGAALLLRLGIVWVFSYNLNGMTHYVFEIEQQLMDLVCGGFSPFATIDIFLGKLLGFLPSPNSTNVDPQALAKGLVGLIGAGLTSSSVGSLLFMAALIAILELLMFIFRIVFVYLTALIVIAFMLILSPFIIPMAIFFATERYFKSWLDILMSSMLTPVLLFAFLSLFLDIFTTRIAKIFEILGFKCTDPGDLLNGCPQVDFRAYTKINSQAFAWLMPSDPNYTKKIQDVTHLYNDNPPVQTTINSGLHRAFNANSVSMSAIDFGKNNVQITQDLVLAFITLWILAAIMKSMIGKIPEIASSIVDVKNRYVQFDNASAKEMLQRKMHETRDNIKYVGAAAGLSAINKLKPK